MLTDRGTDFCGRPDTHEYQLFLALNDIDHSKTKAKNPQADSICEPFHKTILDEFYYIAFRKKIYLSVDELQQDLDKWMHKYNTRRKNQGKRCQGRTLMETFLENLPLVKEKMLGIKTEKGNMVSEGFFVSLNPNVDYLRQEKRERVCQMWLRAGSDRPRTTLLYVNSFWAEHSRR